MSQNGSIIKTNTDEARNKALHEILASEEEYRNIAEHIQIDEELTDAVLRDMQRQASIGSFVNASALLYYDVQGYTPAATASLLGLSAIDVIKIRKTDSFIEARKAVMDEVLKLSRRMIEIASMKAVKTLLSCMESDNDKVKLSAAVEVLNRVGLASTQKIEVTSQTGGMATYSDRELEEIVKGGAHVIESTGEVVMDGEGPK